MENGEIVALCCKASIWFVILLFDKYKLSSEIVPVLLRMFASNEFVKHFCCWCCRCYSTHCFKCSTATGMVFIRQSKPPHAPLSISFASHAKFYCSSTSTPQLGCIIILYSFSFEIWTFLFIVITRYNVMDWWYTMIICNFIYFQLRWVSFEIFVLLAAMRILCIMSSCRETHKRSFPSSPPLRLLSLVPWC